MRLQLAGLRTTIEHMPLGALSLLDRLVRELDSRPLSSVPQAVLQEEDAEAGPDGAGAALDDAREGLAELQSETLKAQRELDSLVEQLADADKQLALSRTALQAAQEGLAAAQRETQELAEEKESLSGAIAEARALVDGAGSLRAQTETVKARMAELKTLERDLATAKQEGENARNLLEKLWPAWLQAGALADWKGAIEASAFDPQSPPSAGLLFAALHGYNASLRDSDVKSLHDNLRDVGRRLYPWLKDLGHSESEAATVAEAWADAINQECEGRASIQVAVPGNPASNKWMFFTPTGGSSPDVASVRSWCVSDPQKRPIHRAEISV